MNGSAKTLDRESLSIHFSIFRFNLLPMLSCRWENDVLDSTARYGKFGCLNGGSVTSRQREFESTANDIVGVSTGTLVPFKIPWLYKLYKVNILQLANELGTGRYKVANDIRSAININILPPGSQYEWHVDSNPLTGLLFVTDHATGGGGELLFRPDPRARPTEDWELVIAPRSGDLLLFDAREAAHTVLPVPGPMQRISVPMNYYYADVSCQRPEDLNHYLYSNRVLDGRTGVFPAAIKAH